MGLYASRWPETTILDNKDGKFVAPPPPPPPPPQRKGERISAFFPFTLSPIVASFDFCLASARLCLLLNEPQTKNTPK